MLLMPDVAVHCTGEAHISSEVSLCTQLGQQGSDQTGIVKCTCINK